MFVHSDGITPLLTGQPSFRVPAGVTGITPEAEAAESAKLARAAWDAHRALAWRHPSRRLPPPRGARWDGITCTTWREQHPISVGEAWDLADVQEAFDDDVAAVEAFQRVTPRAAAEIADDLDQYLADLRMLRSLAEQFADDRVKAGDAWQDYDVRRRAQ